jgi:hypothetical protein
MKVTPHVAQNTSGRRLAVADAIARSVDYAITAEKVHGMRSTKQRLKSFIVCSTLVTACVTRDARDANTHFFATT